MTLTENVRVLRAMGHRVTITPRQTFFPFLPGDRRNTLAHLRLGFHYGYPWCCVIEWSVRYLIDPSSPIAREVGCWQNSACPDHYVHCFYHRWRRHR